MSILNRWISYHLSSSLDCSHPSPFILMIISWKIKITVIWLHSENLTSLILIFVEWFNGWDILECYFLRRMMVDSLMLKWIYMTFSKDHPSLLPFLQHPWPHQEKSLLHFIRLHIFFKSILLLSLHHDYINQRLLSYQHYETTCLKRSRKTCHHSQIQLRWRYFLLRISWNKDQPLGILHWLKDRLVFYKSISEVTGCRY